MDFLIDLFSWWSWWYLLIILFIIGMFSDNGTSPTGNYDAKGKPIKCPECRSTSVGDSANHEYWRCNKCGVEF
jgi:DNA-directed RNA polymerase subunit RPC12/RpoP